MGISTYTALHVENEGFWIPAADINGLFFANNKGIMEFKGVLPNGMNSAAWEICKVIKRDDNIFLFSRRSFEYWIYNIQSEKITNHKYHSGEAQLLSNVENINNKVWVFPMDHNTPIINIDLYSRQIIEIQYPCEVALGDSGFIRTVLYEEKIYWMNRDENNIYFFDLDCKNNCIRYRKFEDARYVNCMDVFDNMIVVLYRDKKSQNILGIMDIECENLKKNNVSDVIKLSDSDRLTYFRILYRYYKIFLFPVGNENVKIFENGKVINIQEKKKFKINQKRNHVDIFNNDIQIEGDDVYIYSPSELGIRRLNLKTEKNAEIKINVLSSYSDAIKSRERQNEILNEDSNLTLEAFIK